MKAISKIKSDISHGVTGLVVAGIVFAMGSSAGAATITSFTDRATFNTAVGIPLTLETFNSFGVETSFNITPLDVGDFTLSILGTTPFNNKNFIDIPPPQISQFDVDGSTIANVTTTDTNSFEISFDSAITAFGADFASFNDGSVRSEIILAGETISPSVVGNLDVRFIGFISDTPFLTVRFDSVGGVRDGYGLDNVSFGSSVSPVPLAAALPLFGAGLAVMSLVGWRKKNQSA